MSDTRVEITGNIVVHHPVKQPAAPMWVADLLLIDSLDDAFQKAVRPLETGRAA